MNITPNHTTGRLLSGTVAPYNRVDGNFTGTTAEILRWTACKWGKDEDLVFAQAAVESWWRQDTRGDWTTDASRCPPGHGLGVDGQAGQCSQSYGILQSYYLANIQSFPEAISSTAMNADYAGAVWYACYLGIGGMGTNGVGNAEGCMSPGNIGTADHLAYLAKIKDYQNQRIWTTPNFQQP
jgi:autotransporter family porin